MVKRTEKVKLQTDLQKLQSYRSNLESFKANLENKASGLAEELEASGKKNMTKHCYSRGLAGLAVLMQPPGHFSLSKVSVMWSTTL
jgi:hypothetical protein